MKEPLLEPILRKMRISKVLPIIKEYQNCHMSDIGCGWEAKLLVSVKDYISSGVGIDFKAPKINDEKIKTRQIILDKTLPFEDMSFDVVTMLAVLEHLESPLEIVREIKRILRKDGKLIITAPSVYSKPVLEFLVTTQTQSGKGRAQSGAEQGRFVIFFLLCAFGALCLWRSVPLCLPE